MLGEGGWIKCHVSVLDWKVLNCFYSLFIYVFYLCFICLHLSMFMCVFLSIDYRNCYRVRHITNSDCSLINLIYSYWKQRNWKLIILVIEQMKRVVGKNIVAELPDSGIPSCYLTVSWPFLK